MEMQLAVTFFSGEEKLKTSKSKSTQHKKKQQFGAQTATHS